MDGIEDSWFTFVWCLVEVVMGTKVVIEGDTLKKGEKVLIISNHRTRLDWMFLWGFFLREGRLRNLKIVLKQALKKYIPFGWPMQSANFIFLARDFEKDKSYIITALKYLGDLSYPCQLLLFPEGTDKTPTTTKRSDEFAKKENLKPLEYCIQPRITGFVFFLNLLKQFNLVDAVYDLTIGYQDTIPQNESAILSGFPKECHVHVKRYDISELPDNDEEAGEWLRTKWYQKDERLKQFYIDGKFPKTEREQMFPEVKVIQKMIKMFCLWTLVTSFVIYLFWKSSIIFWWMLICWVALPIVSSSGGLDGIEISYWGKKLASKKKAE
uniref:Phospholipid/glycerol acyltransferase domain-containing protein n=1 Tax=Arcella intermedia TaxID=1963864 RepID=A0A6B2L9T6_9EUKA